MSVGRPTVGLMKAHVEQHAAGPAGSRAVPRGVQPTFDDLGTPLSEVTFVVVDLETTGGSPSQITEIGAVKIRGGEVVGEFHTLVNPGEPIPAFIAVLTGITDATVAHSPRIDSVLPSFLEFARGAVLVAHNAPFDMGFLRAACEQHGIDVARPAVVDTARLARRTLDRDEAPNCKLATLARLFRATTTPTHRALDDARATVDVLHGLFERLGCHGVTTLEEIDTFSRRVIRRSSANGISPTTFRAARASICSETVSSASCTSASRSTCGHASSSTSPRRSRAVAWPRWWGSPRRS